MNHRVIVPFLCLAAVALACVPLARRSTLTDQADGHERSLRRETTHGAAGGRTAIARATAHEREATTSATPLDATLEVEVGPAVRFHFLLVNGADKRLEVTHPDGQRYELAVYDGFGRLVWRWGAERMFTQAVRNTNLAGGEVYSFDEQWTPPSEGRYTAVATLRSTNFPLVRRATFTVGQQLVVR